MAKTIANLAVSVTARTGNFEKGLRRAVKEVKQFGAGVRNIAVGVGTLGTVMAGIGAAGVGAIAGFTQRIAESIDEMSDMGRRARLSAQDMFELKHVADQNGLSLGSFVGAVSKAQVAAVKASEGNQKLAEVFGRLGIKADEFLKLGTNDQIAALADGFASVENPALRSALAVALFGRAGAGLVPVLEGGSEAVKKAREEITRFGKITPAQEAAAGRLDDAWGKLKDSFAAIGRQLGAVLVGPATDMVEWLDVRLPQAVQSALLAVGMMREIWERTPQRLAALQQTFATGLVDLLQGDTGGFAQLEKQFRQQLSSLFEPVDARITAAQTGRTFDGAFQGIAPEIKAQNVVVQAANGDFVSQRVTDVVVPDVRPRETRQNAEQVQVLKQILETSREGNRIIIRGVPAVAQ